MSVWLIEYLNIQIFALIIKFEWNFNWFLEYKRIVSTSPTNEVSPEKLSHYIILKTKYFQYCTPIIKILGYYNLWIS